MSQVIPSSTNNVTLLHGGILVPRKHYQSRSNLLPKSTRQVLPSQWLPLPLSTSLRLLPIYRRDCLVRHGPKNHALAATGTDVAVEEPGYAMSSETADGSSEVSTSSAETSETPSSVEEAPATSSAQSKRPRPVKRSDMPPIKNEELVVGATFTGKVKSIQPFGAFVDFGAFTDGLVHVSQLSDNFVKDVNDVVSIGQEVEVRLVEANIDTKRISLTMRKDDDISNLQQRKDSPGTSNDGSRPRRKPRANQKSSKFVQGQDLEGTVKNLNRAGAFISLPEGEEGFLPTSEENTEGFASMMDQSSLQVGEEVKVRVLRISRGQVTLTMKKEEEIAAASSTVAQGVVHAATNPFARAFRENKDIAAFLDETVKVQKAAQTSVAPKSAEELDGRTSEISSESSEAQDPIESEKDVEAPDTSLNDTVADGEASSEETKEVEASSISTETAPAESVSAVEGSDATANSMVKDDKTSVVVSDKEDVKEVEESVAVTDSVLADPVGADEDSDATVSNPLKSADEVQESIPIESISGSLSPEESVLSATSTTKEATVADGVAESNTLIDAGSDQSLSSESVEVQDSSADDTSVKDETEDHPPFTIENDSPTSTPNGDARVEPAIEDNSVVTNSSEQAGSLPSQDSSPKASISPALVKRLREETGAGMMDCKKALTETGGDLIKAQEFLRKKGLASADKKASRVTAEGRIGSYIHDSRIGVLIEVNCETDFVSRGDIFKELVDDLAMQVAACPQVQYLVTDDVSEDIVNKEREIEMQKEDLMSKPEQIRSKIVDGRIRKRLEELALLEQPYIKNDKMAVKDWVKQTIATIGENIKVKRFVRYNLGEGLEKKSQDFAAEVAAQTAAKAPPVAQPAAVETKEADESPPKVVISAALVKQLREETGAGMMDCKKALSETGGDLEKAQTYLRKKGLSSAEKKSSRLAAEGRIGSYIHDARIGVLIEVNCETDFVGRSEKFKELVDDLAMQVAACPLVEFVSVEDIPESIVSKEKELEMQREDLQSKPENIREKIVEGRISKRLGVLALLEQPYIKDDSLLVKDLIKQTVAAIGENIKVRRFARFTLGETTGDAEKATEA